MFESRDALVASGPPGTSYLERDGTTVNLEGRPQRQRRAVAPPAEDELAFFAGLARRFGVEVDPWPTMLPDDHARAAGGEEPDAGRAAPKAPPRNVGRASRSSRYRSLFSGPAVERVQQLQFQRPADEVELSYEDASARGIAAGSTVTVSSNGTSRSLRARVSRRLRKGVVRIPSEHAEGLHDRVEVKAG